MTKSNLRRRTCALLAGGTLLLFPLALPAGADAGSLQARLSSAQAQAGALAGQLSGEQTQLIAAQRQAAAAAGRERQLSGLLAVGQRRSAALGQQVRRASVRLAVERGRLARDRGVLAQRLVQIYENGTPDAMELVLSSSGYDDLISREAYLRTIEESDTALAGRVEKARDQVSGQLAMVSQLKARADAYDTQLATARSQAGAVRQRAQSTAAQLASIAATRQATLATLRSNISSWTSQIQSAQQVSSQQASQQVTQWIGGSYSIPAYIVKCESGGNWREVNSSSGAGGAYQIMPSTWAAYGGKGQPQNASPAQQSAIAAKIWAAQGPSAWVCAGG